MKEWREQNRAAPHIINAILFGISSLRKGDNTSTPSFPLDVANYFEKQIYIGWIQVIMGLLANNWSEIQNLHLQLLGRKTTGEIWIYALIRKIWDISWDSRNFWNHMIYVTDGSSKLWIIELVKNRVTYQLEKWATGLLTICHFIFHTSIHTLLSRPIRQQMSWLAAISRAKRWLRHQTPGLES